MSRMDVFLNIAHDQSFIPIMITKKNSTIKINQELIKRIKTLSFKRCIQLIYIYFSHNVSTGSIGKGRNTKMLFWCVPPFSNMELFLIETSFDSQIFKGLYFIRTVIDANIKSSKSCFKKMYLVYQ